MTAEMPDLGALLAQAQAVQQQMLQAQQRLAEQRTTGTSGGGLVTATVDGRGDLLAVHIDPGALDTGDAESLETLADLVVAAVRDARASAEQLAAQSMDAVTGGMLGGTLGELFGASADDERLGPDA
jgi:DNA-binding YbaB/EbfC family protein